MLAYLLIAIFIVAIAFSIAITLVLLGIRKFDNDKKILGTFIFIAGIGWSFFVLMIIIPIIVKASIFMLLFKPQWYLAFDEKLKSPDRSVWFALYHDYGGIGDPDWHVFKIPINEIPEKLKIPTAYKNNDSGKYDLWKNRMLMWNWSEAGNHTSNPHIKIFHERYLVFIRGGYYHGLYDIKNDKTLITDTSPWHSLVYSRDRNSQELKLRQIDAQMDKWVEDTLHNPIKKIIETGQ